MSKYFLGKLLSKVIPKQKTTGTGAIKSVKPNLKKTVKQTKSD